MLQEDDYTFVTIDSEETGVSDAVVVDVSADDGFLDAVAIDDASMNGNDFISLADDTVMLSDSDMMDGYAIDMDSADISFGL